MGDERGDIRIGNEKGGGGGEGNGECRGEEGVNIQMRLRLGPICPFIIRADTEQLLKTRPMRPASP